MSIKFKLLSCLLMLLLVSQGFAGVVKADVDFAGGNGTEGSPFLIASPEHLNNVRNYLGEDHIDKYFKLAANIDLNLPPWNEGYGWDPIGDASDPFMGNFDGYHFIISNLYIYRPNQSWVGLFGRTKNARISNVRMADIDITADTYVGGLSGEMGSNIGENQGVAIDCHITGTIRGNYYVGGLVGQSYDEIRNSSSTVDVTGKNMWIGGLVGGLTRGVIEDCYARGNVSGSGDSWVVGGLVGLSHESLIKNSYAGGEVIGQAYVGGLLGDGGGTIEDSYATGNVIGTGVYSWSIGGLAGGSGAEIRRTYAAGDVKGDDYIGGLVGENVGNISNSFAIGKTSGSLNYGYGVGGLVGYNRSTIDNCYSIGLVVIGDPAGGLVGENIGTVSNSFWDKETSRKETSYGGTGKTTAEMQDKDTFTAVLWDFETIWDIDTERDYHYPYLQNLPLPPYSWKTTLGELNIGDRVVDPSWKWQYRLGPNYSDQESYPGIIKPVTWIVVAKEHYDIVTPHVTLIAEELVGRYPFDDSTNRGSEKGSNHWGNSGSYNAEHGLRTFFQKDLYSAFSHPFRKALLTIPLPNKLWDTGADYLTEDRIFVISQTELGDDDEGTYEIGRVLPYFDLAHADGPTDPQDLINRRRAELPGWSLATGYEEDYYYYFTRSPSTEGSDIIRNVHDNGSTGYFLEDSVTRSFGLRPAVNLCADTVVSSVLNINGAHEIISEMEEYRVLYIPVEFPDEVSPQPDKTMDELKQRASWVEDYYFRQSFGRILIKSIFLSEERVELRKTKREYVREFDILKDSIALAGIDSNNYDAVVVIAPGDRGRGPAFASYRSVPNTDPVEVVITNQVYLEDSHLYGVWAHELGHAIFKWFDYYERSRYIWTRGNTTYWGLMGHGTNINPPGHIIAYHKEMQGWIDYETITPGQSGYYDIPYLSQLDLNDTVLRLEVNNELVNSYIFEGRHPADTDHDKDLLGSNPPSQLEEEGIKIFLLEKRDNEVMYFGHGENKVGYNISGTYMYTIPSAETSNPLLMPRYATLRPGETYYDDPSGLYFDAVQQGSQLQVGIFPHHIYDRFIVAMKGVRTHYPLDDEPEMYFSNSNHDASNAPQTENLFDVDLRIICSEGRIMGMDYGTGQYLRQIPEARASGNILGGGPEWVSVPNDLKVFYEIDTSPAYRWMEELGVLGLDIEVVVLHILIDENGVRTTEEETIWLELRLPGVFRIAGANRYTTAVDVSQEGWPDGADTVLLARGDNFPDSLAGVSLAYQLNAPILLTPSTSLHDATKQEIERLGAGRVIILGGTGAISASVEAELLAMSTVHTVDRLGGANRYETARLIAEELHVGASFDTAFIASGLGFPDALAAASYGAVDGYPILLTGKDSLPAATKDALDNLPSIQRVVIVGGEAVISSAVEDELIDRGLSVERIMGLNRYETALELAKAYLPQEAKEIFIATGLNFPDALAGGVLAAKRGSGVLLVQGDRANLPDSVEAFLTERDITWATILGGTSAVSEGIEERLLELLE